MVITSYSYCDYVGPPTTVYSIARSLFFQSQDYPCKILQNKVNQCILFFNFQNNVLDCLEQMCLRPELYNTRGLEVH